MTSENKNERLFLIGMILSMLCWGISWASGKILTGYGDPLNISLFRFALTFVSLFVIVIATGEKLVIARKGFLDLFFASLMIAVYTWLFFQGLVNGKAGAGGVLVTTLNPVIALVLMLLFTWRKPTKNELLGIGVGIIAGLVLLNVFNNWSKIWNTGNTYFVLATFSWAFLSQFTARSARYGSPMVFSLWMYGLCTLALFFVADGQQNYSIIQKADLKFWSNLFFSGTITTALATTFYFIATSKIGASKASSYIFLVPFSAALGSWIFLAEVPEIHTIAGGLLGILAVYILNKK